MRSVEAGASYTRVWREGVLRPRKMATNRRIHRMVVVLMQRRQTRCLCISHLVLLLLSPLGSCHHCIRAGLVRRVV